MTEAPKQIWLKENEVGNFARHPADWQNVDAGLRAIEYVRADELEEARREAWNAAIEAAAVCIEAQTWWTKLSQGHIGAKKPADYAEAILALKKPEAE